MVTVHEQYIRKSRPPVDTIHNKNKIRQIRKHQMIHLPLDLREQKYPQDTCAHDTQADESNPFRRFPEYLLMTPDKQFIQVFEPLTAAPGPFLYLYDFLTLALDRTPGFLHLVHMLRQDLLIDLPELCKRPYLPKRHYPAQDPAHQYRRAYCFRQYTVPDYRNTQNCRRRNSIGRRQRQGD